MFQKGDEEGYKELMEKARMKTLVYGEKTLMTKFKLAKGAAVPFHDHPHEQTGYLLSGRMGFTVGDEKFTAEAGDSWCIPGNLGHSADVIEDSVVIEVFSPVREDYLP
ncbi:MAG: cupin domain-containing protein [Desulfobacterales bacterium]|nr:cupin domain-containing protein [Desulfobacterales bacterium]